MNHRQDVEQYVEGVLKGTIVAGRHIIAACQRYRNDIEQADEKGWFLDETIVSAQIDFMESLKHTKGQWAGKAFKFSAPQKFFVWNVLGFRMVETVEGANGPFHPRRFRQAYLTVARKFGKSTFVAFLIACLMFYDFPIEVDAECYSTATKEDQAKRIVTQLARTLKEEPELANQAEFFKYREQYTSVQLPGKPYSGTFLKALGSESRTLDALNVHVDARDEIHEWQKQHVGMWEKMETGSGSRLQPLSLITTTAGDENSTIWNQYDSYCVKVLESAIAGDCIDEKVFAFIARLDEPTPCECGGADSDCEFCVNGEIPGDDPFDEANWPKANPGIGSTPSWDSIRGKATKAKNLKAYESTFIRYNMNCKVRSVNKCIHPNLWAKRAIKMAEWSGNCFGAWDIGTRDDLAGIAAVKKMDDGTFQGRAIGLCPEDGPRDLNREPWASWIEQGHLIVTPGDTLQLTEMESIILDWNERFGVTQWAYDTRHSLQMAQNLELAGVECYSFIQSFMQYNEPLRDFLQKLAGYKDQEGRNQGQFFHDGNPFLAYCAGNLARKERNELWMVDKEKAEDKIDPMVALVMAYARAAFSPAPVASIFQRRGSLAV